MGLGVAAFVAALVVCELVRAFAVRRALVDRPNDRSLHVVPTPRLGGVGIVLAVLAFALVPRALATRELAALTAGSVVLGLVGLRDDVRPLSARLRFVLQVGVGVGLVGVAGARAELLPGIPLPVAVGAPLLVVWFVGFVNVFNFMDGMDGLAGSQAFGAALALGALLAGTELGAVFPIVAAAALGFLAHNVPPARMFLGDAGSYFLGSVFAGVAILAAREGLSLGALALPFAPFLLDATFTMIRRARRGERLTQAHRTHLYQRAVQTGASHREVLLVYLVWIAAAAGAALVAPRSVVAVLAGWLGALLGLGAVWRWVVRRESERPDRA